MAIKRAHKFQLSHDETYTLIETNYLGPMIDCIPLCCANCGKLIVKVATIADASNKNYDVGMDCAETLTTLHGDDWELAKSNMRHAISFVSKVEKMRKLGDVKIEADEHSKSCGYVHASGTIEKKVKREGKSTLMQMQTTEYSDCFAWPSIPLKYKTTGIMPQNRKPAKLGNKN